MKIIGINAYHPDASVALIQNGEVIWAAEEERFTRIKHDCGFPEQALLECIRSNSLQDNSLDYIAVSGDKKANILRKLTYGLTKPSGAQFVLNRLKSKSTSNQLPEKIRNILQEAGVRKYVPVHYAEHHVCHVSSSVYCSPFDRTAFASVDGLGDFVSTMTGVATDSSMRILDRVYFPHSLGFFYTAATQYLGFHNYGEEYKVMGLASYGTPEYVGRMSEMIRLNRSGRFQLSRKYFRHQTGKEKMYWQRGVPAQDILFSESWSELLGRPRDPKQEITQKEMNVAASVQAVMETVYFHILNALYKKTRCENLCLSGGVAYNCVANGKITDSTPFKNIYIQAAAGDSGTAIGAALHIYRKYSLDKKRAVMLSALKGPQYEDADIQKILDASDDIIYERKKESDLLKFISEKISAGAVVGWFQDRMEYGPRALGARSILADPRRGDIKDLLNEKVKFREKFRPFAPMVKEEKANEYFEMKCSASPFMLNVFPVREQYRSELKGITHVDGSARVQTVSKEVCPKLWKLLDAMESVTGMPVLLNTSFNENEPIVNSPKEALDCFLRTRMDYLILGSYLIRRS